jgi:hypothetical protein
MAKQTMNARAQRSLLVCVFLGSGALLSAQEICAYVDTDDYVSRLNGNTVQGSVESSLSGPCAWEWSPMVEAWLYRDSLELSYAASSWGAFGGTASVSPPPANLSTWGPGTYIVYGLHWVYCPMSGVNYLSQSTTTILPHQRQLQCWQTSSDLLHWC